MNEQTSEPNNAAELCFLRERLADEMAILYSKIEALKRLVLQDPGTHNTKTDFEALCLALRANHTNWKNEIMQRLRG